MTEYHFDGFRFDGVTSMLYHDHGLGTDFNTNDKYFSYNTHTEAITYLQLANQMVRQVNPMAVTIAEDMSGMPGMCLPIADGGIGFDYRLGMGLPDMWVHAVRDLRDEDWDIFGMWCSMCMRRPGENTVAYVESHDQALVGDKTLIFRLADAAMYTDMDKATHNPVIDRAIALHKMARLFTLGGGGEAYLNFMGNEFGHPEWIDFPREGNGWSFHYCRRQWSLRDNGYLKYQWLGEFDQDMIDLAKSVNLFQMRFGDLRLKDSVRLQLQSYSVLHRGEGESAPYCRLHHRPEHRRPQIRRQRPHRFCPLPCYCRQKGELPYLLVPSRPYRCGAERRPHPDAATGTEP